MTILYRGNWVINISVNIGTDPLDLLIRRGQSRQWKHRARSFLQRAHTPEVQRVMVCLNTSIIELVVLGYSMLNPLAVTVAPLEFQWWHTGERIFNLKIWSNYRWTLALTTQKHIRFSSSVNCSTIEQIYRLLQPMVRLRDKNLSLEIS